MTCPCARTKQCLSALFSAALLWATASAQAQQPSVRSLDQIVPDSTVFFVHLPDATAFRQLGSQLEIHNLYRNHRLRQLIDTALRPVARGLLVVRGKTELELADLLDLPQGQAAVAITMEIVDRDEPPETHYCLLMDVGSERASVEEIFGLLAEEAVELGAKLKEGTLRNEKVMTVEMERPKRRRRSPRPRRPGQAAPQPEEPPETETIYLHYGFSGSLLVAGTSLRQVRTMMTRWQQGGGPNLKSGYDYRQMRKRLEESGEVYAYFDLARLLKVQLAREDAREPRDMARRVIGALHLEDIHAIGASLDFDPAKVAANLSLFAYIPRAEGGLSTFLTTLPIREWEVAAAVPDDAVSFSLNHFDALALFDILLEVAREVQPAAGMFLEAGLAALIDPEDPPIIRDDLIAPLSGQWMSYDRVGEPYPDFVRPVHWLSLTNGKAFEFTFEKLMRLSPQHEQVDMDHLKVWKSQRDLRNEMPRWQRQLMRQLPDVKRPERGIFVTPNRVVAVTGLEELERFRVPDKKLTGSLVNSPTFQRVSRYWPQKVTGVSYTNMQRAIRFWYNFVTSRLIPFFLERPEAAAAQGSNALLQTLLNKPLPPLRSFDKHLPLVGSWYAPESQGFYVEIFIVPAQAKRP